MRVSEIMSHPVVTVTPTESLKDVARLLVERDISAAPVLDEGGGLVGMVSEADVMQLELHEDPRRHLRPVSHPVGGSPQHVADVMTTDVLAVPPDADVASVAQLMIDRRLRSLPVVDGRKVAGIVSRRDVLRVLLRTDADIAADLSSVLAGLPSTLGSWSVEVSQGVALWRGQGPEQIPEFLTRLAFTVPGVVDVRIEDETEHEPTDGRQQDQPSEQPSAKTD